MTHYPDLWMRAYANIYSNKGALTKGVDENTLDGMSEKRINEIISKLKDGRYQPRPAKRVYIPKKNGKRRPLGVPTADDKLVQEVVRLLLEQIYEPIFLDRSHGFRPKRSCHTALTQIREKWKSVKWIVDMDISGFYDNINHKKLVDILEKKIDDREFIGLIKLFLQAGYLENWKFHGTYSGTPQGGICSPVLANIFLHELDKFVEKEIEKYNKGGRRRTSYEPYAKLEWTVRTRRAKKRELEKRGDYFPLFMEELDDEIRALGKRMKALPSGDPFDENYRKLHYVRYADDFALGVVGSKSEAKEIAARVTEFIEKELKLEIASEKSGIHYVGNGFNFLGYFVSFNTSNKVMRKTRRGTLKDGSNVYGTSRSIRSQLGLQIPKEKVWEFCKRSGYLKNGKPIHRPELLSLSDFEIVSTYNAEVRGFANYYNLAAKRRLIVLEWAATSSMWKTLAHKHRTSSQKMRRKMKAGDEHILRYQVKGDPKTLKVFKIKHRSAPNPRTADMDQSMTTVVYTSRNEIIQRLNAQTCEYCGKANTPCEVHHIHSLKKLKNKKSRTPWEILMCARARKTMVLCKECHTQLHKGELPGWKKDHYNTTMESVVQRKLHATFGGGHTPLPPEMLGLTARPDWW